MFIPLVDTLRCVQPHEETWLVASIDRAEDRDIIEGTLGCPKCLAEYPVRDGVVHFADTIRRPPFHPPSEESAVRLAAALDLTDPRMTAVLHGAWGAAAPLIRGLSPVQLLLVNPPEGITSGDGISIVTAKVAPIAASSVNAVAVDDGAGPEMLSSLRNILRGGGRMVGHVAMNLPAGLVEMARDDEIWVAQLEASAVTSAPILPTRRSR